MCIMPIQCIQYTGSFSLPTHTPSILGEHRERAALRKGSLQNLFLKSCKKPQITAESGSPASELHHIQCQGEGKKRVLPPVVYQWKEPLPPTVFPSRRSRSKSDHKALMCNVGEERSGQIPVDVNPCGAINSRNCVSVRQWWGQCSWQVTQQKQSCLQHHQEKVCSGSLCISGGDQRRRLFLTISSSAPHPPQEAPVTFLVPCPAELVQTSHTVEPRHRKMVTRPSRLWHNWCLWPMLSSSQRLSPSGCGSGNENQILDLCLLSFPCLWGLGSSLNSGLLPVPRAWRVLSQGSTQTPSSFAWGVPIGEERQAAACYLNPR